MKDQTEFTIALIVGAIIIVVATLKICEVCFNFKVLRKYHKDKNSVPVKAGWVVKDGNIVQDQAPILPF